MRNAVLVALVLLCVVAAQGQFKSQVADESRISSGLMREQPSFLFGWFDPSKFQMHHMVSFSYQSIAGMGMSLGTYTNMMSYQFSDNLEAQADVSLMYSPYNAFSTGLGKKNDFSGIFLSRAQVTYRPWENTTLQLQYRAMPYGYYSYGSPFYSPWYWEAGR